MSSFADDRYGAYWVRQLRLSSLSRLWEPGRDNTQLSPRVSSSSILAPAYIRMHVGGFTSMLGEFDQSCR